MGVHAIKSTTAEGSEFTDSARVTRSDLTFGSARLPVRRRSAAPAAKPSHCSTAHTQRAPLTCGSSRLPFAAFWPLLAANPDPPDSPQQPHQRHQLTCGSSRLPLPPIFLLRASSGGSIHSRSPRSKLPGSTPSTSADTTAVCRVAVAALRTCCEEGDAAQRERQRTRDVSVLLDAVPIPN